MTELTTESTLHVTGAGWPMILSGLKSLLETGKPLNIPVPQPPREPRQ